MDSGTGKWQVAAVTTGAPRGAAIPIRVTPTQRSALTCQLRPRLRPRRAHAFAHSSEEAAQIRQSRQVTCGASATSVPAGPNPGTSLEAAK
jgi:hypothetical protein